MSDRVSVARCQRRLAALWGICSLVIFGVIMIQSVGGKYIRADGNVEFDRSADVWQWFLPLVIPTLSLMIGCVVAEAQKSSSRGTVPRFIYRLSFWLSLVYLTLVLLQLFIWQSEFFERLDSSTLYLASVQSLVGLALGAFFVSRDQRTDSDH